MTNGMYIYIHKFHHSMPSPSPLQNPGLALTWIQFLNTIYTIISKIYNKCEKFVPLLGIEPRASGLPCQCSDH